MDKRDIGKLAAAIAVCQLAGIIGSFYTVQAIPEWYAALEKPLLTPRTGSSGRCGWRSTR